MVFKRSVYSLVQLQGNTPQSYSNQTKERCSLKLCYRYKSNTARIALFMNLYRLLNNLNKMSHCENNVTNNILSWWILLCVHNRALCSITCQQQVQLTHTCTHSSEELMNTSIKQHVSVRFRLSSPAPSRYCNSRVCRGDVIRMFWYGSLPFIMIILLNRIIFGLTSVAIHKYGHGTTVVHCRLLSNGTLSYTFKNQ